MTIKDFAESRGENQSTVGMYLIRYEEKHPAFHKFEEDGKNLSAECLAVLEAKYPYPEPVAIYNHHPDDQARIQEQDETITMMVKRTDKLIERTTDLQDRLDAAQKQIAENAQERMRIEAHDQQTGYELAAEKKRGEELQAALDEKDAKIEELQEALQAEQKKSWLDKLLKR